MISLIFAIIFFILFIFFSIAGLNYLLRSMVDNVLSKKEKFENFDNFEVKPVDQCKKIDELTESSLNFQTATNIPLSPNYYKNYVGSIYINDNPSNSNDLNTGKYCLTKNKLLYDGIWNPNIENKSPYLYETWELTNSDLTDGYYCSDKLFEVNKPFPDNYIDKSSTPPPIGMNYYNYYNDTKNDVNDTEIYCFSSVFNEGITEDLKIKEKCNAYSYA